MLVFPTFSEFEMTVATAPLRDRAQLDVLALSPGPVQGEAGWTVLPSVTPGDVNPDEYAALLIPGGDMQPVADAPELFALVREMHARGKLLAAICGGPFVLAKAGVLSDCPYTVTFTPEQRAFLGCFNEARYQYAPVVESGNVITAQGHAFVDFGIAFAKRLGMLSPPGERFFRGEGNAAIEEMPKA